MEKILNNRTASMQSKDSKFLSRRDVLKGMTAVAATAALAGCSSGDSSDDSVISPKDNLVYDTEMKTCFSSGPYNCGAKCLHKIHYKNGRLYHFTSAGDIPREGSYEKDNSEGTLENPIQRRACVRGYGYLQRLYQPDRLKYPLMRIEGKPRGEPDSFKRVSWDEAVDAAAQAIHKAIQRRSEIGYTPIFSRWMGLFMFMLYPGVAPCIYTVGNESTGAADGAKFDMIGDDAHTNNVSDRLNSDFIITWGLDPTRTTYYVEHAHWYNTVCKEDGRKELVCITPNYSDTAGMLTTGINNYNYIDFEGNPQTRSVGGWVPCRPTTDAALASAMAYVLYKKHIQNGKTGPLKEDYIKTVPLGDEIIDNRKSFGFYADDIMESVAPITASETTLGYFINSKNLTAPVTMTASYTHSAGKTLSAGDPYKGTVFQVPAGESFEEYLLSLEVTWAKGAIAAGTNNYKYPQPATPATPASPALYYGVLNYAAKLTGVPWETIETLAFKYAEPLGQGRGGVSFLDVGGGPQRAWNGVEWVQMMVALCTMTGFIDKQGGGAGFAMMGHPDKVVNKATASDPGGMLPNIEAPLFPGASSDIFISMSEWANVAINGKDYRSRERFIEEIKATSGVDLSTKNGQPNGTPKALSDKLLEMDVWIMRAYNGLHTLENVNKIRHAADQLKTIICLDQTMHPTALHSDIVFPVNSHYENGESINSPSGGSAIFKMDAPLKDNKLYDTKSDDEILALINERLNEIGGYAFPGLTPSADVETSYDTSIVVSDVYTKAVGNFNKPDYETFNSEGTVDFVIPRGKAVIGMKDINEIGKLCNTTGVVNFWQPLWGALRPNNVQLNKAKYANPWGLEFDGFRNPTACYQPNLEGFENFFENGDIVNGAFTGYDSPFNGRDGWQRNYKLLYLTNKSRNRAHTVFDNTAIIKDQFKQEVYLNPVDANARGINDGDMVYVYNDRGCTYIPAKVTHYIVPGIISVEHGAWYRPHPTETVPVWQDYGVASDGETPVFTMVDARVDIGGCENILTLGIGTAEHYCGQAVSAHGGPCEVSKTKPGKTNI